MTPYFAYGSNMNRAQMRVHCPQGSALGTGVLAGWRFVITTDRYASIVPAPGDRVHGVLWRLTPRDLARLNAYESIDSGLYRVRTLAVRMTGTQIPALVYIGRSRTSGRPRPGYLDTVLAAAREWGLPDDYVRALARWAPGGLLGARAPECGELA